MKKLLLGSTALVVGGVMAAPAMAADPIKIGVSGPFTGGSSSMGVSMRDNRLENEYGLVFSLTLKDFPSVSLPFDIGAD